MGYFQHNSISFSDLRAFRTKMGLCREMPQNMQAIYDFGTLVHQTILEPHLISKTVLNEDIVKAQKMRTTFFKNEMCRDFVMADDYVREHEFYTGCPVDESSHDSTAYSDLVQVGPYQYKARCKADGYRYRMKWFMELKGLNVTSKQAFEDALINLDYDAGIVHYMATSRCDLCLVPAISKKKTELMFTKIVKKHDNFYLEAEHKLIQTLKLLHEWSPEDVQKIAA